MAFGLMTLGQIRTAARQRSDMVNSQFVTDSEFNSYINQSYYELYDLLTQEYGNDYNVALPLVFATDGQLQQYPLPDGILFGAAAPFYKLRGVDLQLSNSQDSWVTVPPFNFQDRNKFAVPNFQSFYGVTNLRYKILGNNIMFTPIPAAGQFVRIWYVPRMVELLTDDQPVDGVSGWTEYIICDAAIKALQKEESDVTVLGAEKLALIQRIEAAANNRDAANPITVHDSQSVNQWYPTGNGVGNGGW